MVMTSTGGSSGGVIDRTGLNGSPDSFWSEDEEWARFEEVTSGQETRPPSLRNIIGRGALFAAVFDLTSDPDDPHVLHKDPYGILHHN